jgi:hypothetical protein
LRTELTETEEALRKASELAPGREDLTLLFADIMMGNGEDLAARATLMQLKGAATSDRTRETIDRRLASLQARIDAAQARCDAEALQRTGAIASTSTTSTERQAARTAAAASPPVVTPPASSASRTNAAALRPTRQVAGSRLDGFLTEMDCAKGLTLHVRTDAGSVLFHTDTPEQINFVSYSANGPKEFACGPLSPEQHVVIVYRPGNGQGIRGEPLAVELVP